jgi:hypothetical protein
MQQLLLLITQVPEYSPTLHPKRSESNSKNNYATYTGCAGLLLCRGRETAIIGVQSITDSFEIKNAYPSAIAIIRVVDKEKLKFVSEKARISVFANRQMNGPKVAPTNHLKSNSAVNIKKINLKPGK